MTKNLLLLILLILPFVSHAQTAPEKRFKLNSDNKKYEAFCRNVENILNDPINKDFTILQVFGQPNVNTDFKIPKPYSKRYSRPEWISVKNNLDAERAVAGGYSDFDIDRKLGSDYIFEKSNTQFVFDPPDLGTGLGPFYRVSINNANGQIGSLKCLVGEQPWYIHRFEDSSYSNSCNFIIDEGQFAYTTSLYKNKFLKVTYAHSQKMHDNGGNYLAMKFDDMCTFEQLR